MGRTVTAGNLILGEGIPKTIVPVSGEEGLLPGIRAAKKAGADMIEWRCDGIAGLREKALPLLDAMGPALSDTPLLFTCRTKAEGGQGDLRHEDYLSLLQQAAAHPAVTLVDVEVFSHPNTAACLSAVKTAGKLTVASRHDFQKTPPQEELLCQLIAMEQLGADVVKIAVMPNAPSDVLALLGAVSAYTARENSVPAIAIAMGELGRVSRIAGGIFGSAATFTCVGEGSAPGQLPMEALRACLNALHRG